MRNTPKVNERTQKLRKQLTDAERHLWGRIRRHQLNGYRFRRQAPIGRYIVDFVCLSERLIIEVDGGQHSDRRDVDARRTEWLESQNFRVLRFWNNEVFENIEGVIETIASALEEK